MVTLETVGLGAAVALVGLSLGTLFGFVTKRAFKPIVAIIVVVVLAVAASYLRVGPGFAVKFDLSNGGTIPTFVTYLTSKLPGLETSAEDLTQNQPVLSFIMSLALLGGLVFGMLRGSTPRIMRQTRSPHSVPPLGSQSLSSQSSQSMQPPDSTSKLPSRQTLAPPAAVAGMVQFQIATPKLQHDVYPSDPRIEKAEYLLRKMMTLHGAELQTPRHAYEFLRWEDLVVALLCSVTKPGSGQSRERVLHHEDAMKLVANLNDLELLNVPDLANVVRNASSPNLDDPHARHVIDLFQEAGLDSESARRELITVCEAALALQDRFGGKVQRYLRSYGLAMLKDVGNIFRFSGLDQNESAMAFIDWLQNDLIMPLCLPDESVQILLKSNGLELTDLVHAADRIDLNVALIDDLARLYLAGQTNSKAQSESHNF